MGNTVTVVKDEITEVFEDVLGHQVGNGAIQILERNGNQRIINNFDDVLVFLDKEASEKFEFDLKAMEAGVPEEGSPVSEREDNVVPIAGEVGPAEDDGTTQH